MGELLLWNLRTYFEKKIVLSLNSKMGFIHTEKLAQPDQLDRENDLYMHRNVLDLFSLKERVTVITGGARGIGLALAFAVAEVGSHVAILDISDQPHEHFYRLQRDYGVVVRIYK